MREGSEINGNEKQEKNGNATINQSINQSSELHLVKSENLKDLLDTNSWLQKYRSVDDKLEIKTTEDFDKTVKFRNSLGFKTAQEARDQTEDLDQDIKNEGGLKPWFDKKRRYYEHSKMNNPEAVENYPEKIEKELETYLSAKKFCRYERALCDFWFKNIDDMDLKKRYSDTMELLDKKLKLKTLEDFYKTAEIINSFGFKTTQEAHDEAEKFDKAEKNKKELESWLLAKQFCHYEHALNSFFNSVYSSFSDDYGEIFVAQDDDYYSFSESIKKYVSKKQTNKLVLIKSCLDIFACKSRELLINNGIVSLIQLKNKFVLENIRRKISSFHCLTRQLILSLLSNPDRYNFFLQWHKMLEKNLPQEDKQLFYDYLNSCREKLQDEKDNYRIFDRQIRNLTAIVIFGIVASPTVLTIYFMEIYAAPWFFWFGIVGVILTVAVGIRLFLCLKENWNDLKKLESDLLQNENGKTVAQKINEINCAMGVYDLDKIRNFKESEPKKISMLENDKNENKIINGQIKEINTDDPSNTIKLKPINTEPDISKNDE